MSFEDKLEKMQNLYLDMERQFQEAAYTIPLDNPQEVYSPRFYTILQFACAQIHSLFKIISKNLELKIKGDRFLDYYKALNEKGILEIQSAFIKPLKSIRKPLYPLIPETSFKIIPPEWWSSYNETKHELPEGVKKGALGNVLDAMAATFILNGIANFTRNSDILSLLLDKKNWHHVVSDSTMDSYDFISSQNPFQNSPFFFDSTQLKSGKIF